MFMSKITYKQIETEEILLEEEAENTETGFICDICEDENWNLEEIFDLKNSDVLVIVNQIL